MYEYFGFAACAQLGRAGTLPKDPCPPVYFLLLTLVLVVLLLVEYAVVAVVVGSATCSTVAATVAATVSSPVVVLLVVLAGSICTRCILSCSCLLLLRIWAVGR